MEAITELAIECEDEKMSSFNHTELDSESGKIRPDSCILPKRHANGMADEIVFNEVPLVTVEIGAGIFCS